MKLYYKFKPRGAINGWMPGKAPVIPKGFRMCQDAFVIKEDHLYRMWFSWSDPRIIAYSESMDGVEWEYPTAVLPIVPGSEWEGNEVCRPCILYKDGRYHMWYTGKTYPSENSRATSCIGYATSDDGLNWQRHGNPVLIQEEPWEGNGVTYSHVLWDDEEERYKMWYSAEEIREAKAIGYATSKDGINWKKYECNPILSPCENHYFEAMAVSGSYVIRQDGFYYLFYTGFDKDGIPSLGLVRSKDGISAWASHPSNPICAGTDGSWDWLGIRSPSVMMDQGQVKIWYTGLDRGIRNIGLLIHDGISLAFDGKVGDERSRMPELYSSKESGEGM